MIPGVQRAVYATAGSGLSCTYCGSRGDKLYEYTLDGDQAGAVYNGFFCSDVCFENFHHVAIAA